MRLRRLCKSTVRYLATAFGNEWGRQIRLSSLQSPTIILYLSYQKFGSMFSAKYYVLKQSFQYSKRYVIALGLFGVVVNNQRNVYKSIFKIDCNIVSKRTVDQTPNAAPESMVIFIPEEKSFTSKICELIDKPKPCTTEELLTLSKQFFFGL